MNPTVYDMNFISAFFGAVVVVDIILTFQNYDVENYGFRMVLDGLRNSVPFLFVAFTIMAISNGDMWYTNLAMGISVLAILTDAMIGSSAACRNQPQGGSAVFTGWCSLSYGAVGQNLLNIYKDLGIFGGPVHKLAIASFAVLPLLWFSSNPNNVV